MKSSKIPQPAKERTEERLDRGYTEALQEQEMDLSHKHFETSSLFHKVNTALGHLRQQNGFTLDKLMEANMEL